MNDEHTTQNNSLLRYRHQVLRAQIITQSVKQLFVRWVWIHVGARKGVNGRSE